MNEIRVGASVVHWPRGGLMGEVEEVVAAGYEVRWIDGSRSHEDDSTIVMVIRRPDRDTPPE